MRLEDIEFDWRQALRLTGIIVVGIVVQLTAISQLSLFGAQPDLAPLIAVDIGLLCGAETGALSGFGIGLLLDMALLQTLGVSSLVYVAVGYLGGRQRELRDMTNSNVPVIAGAAATVAGLVLFSFIQFLLGVDAPVAGGVFWEIVGTTLINAVIAYPVFALIRRILAPGLDSDVLPRRRRARTGSARLEAWGSRIGMGRSR